MAQIEPFRALRYDPTRVSIPQVVTQPYDKITPAMQDGYYAASPYNLVRVILANSTLETILEKVRTLVLPSFSVTGASREFFLQDAKPSLYLYVQRFKVPGGSSELERRGIIAWAGSRITRQA